MILSEWREFPSAPSFIGKKNLMTARVSMLLKSRASLTCFRACFLPGWAKDLSAPRYNITDFWVLILPGAIKKKRESLPEITVSIFHLSIYMPVCKTRHSHYKPKPHQFISFSARDNVTPTLSLMCSGP